jgi:hypothetical protein
MFVEYIYFARENLRKNVENIRSSRTAVASMDVFERRNIIITRWLHEKRNENNSKLNVQLWRLGKRKNPSGTPNASPRSRCLREDNETENHSTNPDAERISRGRRNEPGMVCYTVRSVTRSRGEGGEKGHLDPLRLVFRLVETAIASWIPSAIKKNLLFTVLWSVVICYFVLYRW